MSNGEHGEKIARLDERDRMLLQRLDRIEDKVDGLVPTVARIGGSVALLVSLAASAAVITIGG